MRPLLALSGSGLLAFLAAAFILTYLQKFRLEAARVQSQHNLRQLAFAVLDVQSGQGETLMLESQAIPPATVVLPGYMPQQRLSWFAPLLPRLDQYGSGAADAMQLMNMQQPWPSETNQQAARVVLTCALCPLADRNATGPALTHYVAIAGVGRDAPNLTLPQSGPTPPGAGPWRYDAPTPLAAIRDGLSNTLLLGETAYQPGPWLQGGRSTTRALEQELAALPLLGTGGQFGGFFPQGGHFAFCDGSVRLLSPHTTPEVLLKLATIADSWTIPPE